MCNHFSFEFTTLSSLLLLDPITKGGLGIFRLLLATVFHSALLLDSVGVGEIGAETDVAFAVASLLAAEIAEEDGIDVGE